MTVKVKFVPAVIPAPATLQSLRLPRFDSFVKVRTESVLRLIGIVAAAPLRLMSLQPGLQVMLKTRKELESVSATTTLVPSRIPLTKAQSPAATVTVCGAALPA